MQATRKSRAQRTALLKNVIVALTILIALFVAARPLNAQTGTAVLSGTVTDTQDAVVPGATVIITNSATGISQTTTTNSVGEFNLVGLPPNDYSLSVDQRGFEKFAVQTLTLHTGDHKQISVKLRPGKATETVTVSSDDENVINTETSVSNVVTAEEIQNQPLNGRSFQDLILLSPGTTTVAGNVQSRFSDRPQQCL